MENKVINILSELSGLENITTDMSLQGDLNFDSLMMVTLLLEIEDSLEIELNESDMNPFDLQTVEDVIKLANNYIGDKNG